MNAFVHTTAIVKMTKTLLLLRTLTANCEKSSIHLFCKAIAILRLLFVSGSFQFENTKLSDICTQYSMINVQKPKI